MIDSAIQPLIDDQTIQMGTVARPLSSTAELHDPGVVKVVIDRSGFALYFSRSAIPYVRDIADTAAWTNRYTFYKHFGLYVYRKEFLLQFSTLPVTELEKAESLEQLRVLEHGYRIHIAVTQDDSVSVDTADDLARVVKTIEGLT